MPMRMRDYILQKPTTDSKPKNTQHSEMGENLPRILDKEGRNLFQFVPMLREAESVNGHCRLGKKKDDESFLMNRNLVFTFPHFSDR
jgi:hypothetical protein